MNLSFEIDESITYGEKVRRSSCLCEFIFNSLNKRKSYFSVLTSVADNQWVPVLDIDDPSAIIPLSKELTLNYDSFVIVRSSPNHCWFLIDRIQTLNDSVSFMRHYAKYCDPKFLELIEKTKKINLRAFIRDFYRPVFEIGVQSHSKLFKDFIQAFHDHFNSKAIAFAAVVEHLNKKQDNEEEMEIIFQTPQNLLEWPKEGQEVFWERI